MPTTPDHLSPEAAWEAGYGRHSQQTRRRVHEMVRALRDEGVAEDGANAYESLHAAGQHDAPPRGAIWPLGRGADVTRATSATSPPTPSARTPGMLWVNRCSWAHCVNEVVHLIDIPRESLLTAPEMDSLDGRRSPQGVVW